MTKERYIIVKYFQEHLAEGFTKLPIQHSVTPDTYTAEACGITEKYFEDMESAEKALHKMKGFNPSVDYGIMPLQSEINYFIKRVKTFIIGMITNK